MPIIQPSANQSPPQVRSLVQGPEHSLFSQGDDDFPHVSLGRSIVEVSLQHLFSRKSKFFFSLLEHENTESTLQHRDKKKELLFFYFQQTDQREVLQQANYTEERVGSFC